MRGDSSGLDGLRLCDLGNEGVGVVGRLEVKYAGSSGSESESGYWFTSGQRRDRHGRGH